MIAAALLLYAVVLTISARPVLSKAWTIRHPGAGLLAWHIVIAGVTLSTVAAALLAAHDAWTPLVAGLFGIYPSTGSHSTAASALLGHEWNASLLILGALTARLLGRAARRLHRTRRDRTHLRAAVAALDPRPLLAPHQDVSAISLPAATAFCIPGQGPKILISHAALLRLSNEQLTAVIAHERAHLHHRHAAWAGWSSLLAESFPSWGLAAAYAQAVPRLHEMQADDRAARSAGNRAVTTSLLALAAPPGSGSLAMAGSDVAIRARRLLDEQGPARGQLTSVAVALTGVLVIPAALFTGPGLTSVSSPHHLQHGHATTLGP